MAAANSTVCNKHQVQKVPSFCLNHSLLVFCCPWCLNGEQTQRVKYGLEELCKIITAGTAAHYLEPSIPITPNAPNTTAQDNKSGTLVAWVETEIEKAENVIQKACQKLIDHLETRPDSATASKRGELGKYLKTRLDVEQMHIYQLNQFSIFLSYVGQTANAYGIAGSATGLTYKCNSKHGCLTCNMIVVKKDQTAVIDNTAGKTFVILKGRLRNDCGSTNVVYAINCTKCRVVIYVGEDQRKFSLRMGDHRRGKSSVSNHEHFKSHNENTHQNRVENMRVRVIRHNIVDKIVRREYERRIIEELDTEENGENQKQNTPLKSTFVKRLKEVTQQSKVLTETYGELFNGHILQLLEKLELSEEGVIEDPIEQLDPFPAFRGEINELEDIQPVRPKPRPSPRRQPKNRPSVVDDVDVPEETDPAAIGSFMTTVIENIVDRRTKDMRQRIVGLEYEVMELTTHLKRLTLTTSEQETQGTH